MRTLHCSGRSSRNKKITSYHQLQVNTVALSKCIPIAGETTKHQDSQREQAIKIDILKFKDSKM